MKTSKLTSILKLLMSELHLREEGWGVKLIIDPDLETVGEVEWEPARKSATIKMWPEAKIQKDAVNEVDWIRDHAVVYTLIHELLHLRLEGHLDQDVAAKGTHPTPLFEWAIDMLARSILRGLIARKLVLPRK
jgi:hypothetical protein